MKFSDLATIRRSIIQPTDFGEYTAYLGFEHFEPGALRFGNPGDPSDVGSAKQEFRPGDTIYGKLRPYFRKVGWAQNLHGICSTDLWVFQPKPGVDPRFVFYVAGTQEFTDCANSSSEGTRMPRAAWSVVRDFEIPDFTLEEQREVSSTLGALDDKIESNYRAMSLLEDMGSALLDSVLSLDAYGLPEYDGGRRLGDFVALVETGSRPKGGAAPGGDGVVSLGAESIQSAGIIANQTFKKVPHEFAKNMRRGRLQDEDILVYKDGGRPGNFIPHVSAYGYGFPVSGAVINEHVYRVRAITGVSQGLMYWILRSSWMDQEMRKRGTGVAIPGLNSANFRDLPMPVLKTEVIDRLNRALSPMLAALLRYGAENTRLRELRDTLLPELLLKHAHLHVQEGAAT